jgi:AcrR family transcriptional regulator
MNKPAPEKKRRFKPEVRRQQIIEATKELILENGLTGSSSLRIAAALGINQSTLYYYFKSRREILAATLSSIMEEIIQKASLSNEYSEEQFENAALTFYEMIQNDPRNARLLLEFLCAPSSEQMFQEVQGISSLFIENVNEIIKNGIGNGLFQKDIDSMIFAWMITSLGLGLSMGVKLELPQFPSKEQAIKVVTLLIKAMRNSLT